MNKRHISSATQRQKGQQMNQIMSHHNHGGKRGCTLAVQVNTVSAHAYMHYITSLDQQQRILHYIVMSC